MNDRYLFDISPSMTIYVSHRADGTSSVGRDGFPMAVCLAHDPLTDARNAETIGHALVQWYKAQGQDCSLVILDREEASK
jgi:hypothetical protein